MRELENNGAIQSASHPFLKITLAGAMLFLSPLAAISSSTNGHSQFAGSYISDESKATPSMSVSLGADGAATITEDAGKGAATLFGHWVDSGNQVTVTFDAVEGAPVEPPMIFQANHNELQAVTWNHSEWDKVAPPPMRKGYKVKSTYWFTTVR